MSFLAALLILGTLFVAGVILAIYLTSARQKALEARIRSLSDFTPAQLHASEKVGVAVDEDRREVCVVSGDTLHRFSFEKIISSEIAEDSATVTKTDRGDQLVGVTIGGLVAGPAGAIIGGLSGATTSREKVKRVEVVLYLDDMKTPVLHIPFLELPSTVDRSGFIAMHAFELAHRWHGFFRAAMHRCS